MYFQSKSDLDQPKSTPPRRSPKKTADNPNHSMDTDQLPTPSPSDQHKAKPVEKSSKKKEKVAKPTEIEHDILESMNKTISSINEYVGTKRNKNKSPAKVDCTQEDDNDIWAKLLSKKMKRMDEMAAEQFKLEVDTLALKYLNK